LPTATGFRPHAQNALRLMPPAEAGGEDIHELSTLRDRPTGGSGKLALAAVTQARLTYHKNSGARSITHLALMTRRRYDRSPLALSKEKQCGTRKGPNQRRIT